MSEAMQDYRAKAQENLAGVVSELAQGRSNSCARSAYYACFHAAIAALLQAGLVAAEPPRGWGHDWVQARFVAQLIHRRKDYAASVRRTLGDLLGLRHQADYRRERVSQRDAQQAVRRAHTFVQAVTARVAGQGGGTCITEHGTRKRSRPLPKCRPVSALSTPTRRFG